MKRNEAEEMFNNIFSTISEKQKDFGDLVEGYISNSTMKTPLIDVLDDDEDVVVFVDLPGIQQDDITIDITEENLEITAFYGEKSDNDGKIFLRNERYNGKLNRKIPIPKGLKINDSSAEFENGVLMISIPKIRDDKNYEVEVN
jgi:HSP20 family protein